MRTTTTLGAGLAAMLMAFVPEAAPAQESATAGRGLPEQQPRWLLGIGVPSSFVIGDANDFLSDGLGILAFGSRHAAGPVWLRADASFVWLRGESFGGERADDALLLVGIGPELDFGWPALRLYLRGSGGPVANFQSRTASSLPEETSWAGFFGGGLGFRVRLAGGTHPVALDLGGDIFKTGELALATTAEAGGTSKQELGMITLRAALTVGLP